MLKKSRGMTLVSVLIAVALLGILAATLATIFGNMSGLYVRSNVASEAQAMTRLVQSVINQKNLCNYAMRGTAFAVTPPGTPFATDFAWDFRTNPLPTFHVPLDHVEINPGGTYASQALVARKADTISPNLQIKDIYLRLPDQAKGEGKPLFSTVKRSNGGLAQTFVTTSAKLVLEYNIPGPIMGTSVRDGVIDVTVAVDPANGNQFAFCYQGQSIQSVDVTCGPTNSFNPCPAFANPCRPMYYVSGFDNSGNPICRCQLVCEQGGDPKPKKVKDAVPGPGPAAPGPGAGGGPKGFSRGGGGGAGGSGGAGGGN